MSGEAIRTPSAGAIFWAEAAPDGSATARAIVGSPPAVQVTLTSSLPSGLNATADNRGLVITRPPISYNHLPTAADLATTPPVAAFTVSGAVAALAGSYHPRLFSVAPTAAGPSYVALRPSLKGTTVGEAGAIMLNLTWQGGAPASWAILQMRCTRNGATLGFSGQADINGDVIVPLTGLPPLPPSQTNDSMTVTALGDATLSGKPAANPDTFRAAQISIGGSFAAQQTVPVRRGQISTLATLKLPRVTLQPN